MRIKLSPLFPTEKPYVQSSLPQPFEFLWASGSSIRNICEQFKTTLNLYQDYWDQVDELKFHTCILEPECPNYAATSFILAVGKQLCYELILYVRLITLGKLSLGNPWCYINNLANGFFRKRNVSSDV